MRSLLLLTYLFLSLATYSQQIRILDAESEEPIEGVTLSSEEPKAFALSDLYGRAEISDFKGAQEIHLRFLGYESKVLSYQALVDSVSTVYLQAGNLELDEVVISARRWRQNAGAVPYQITAIKPKEAALQNPQTAADLLNVSGKVFVQKSQQGGGSPMIRGYAANRLLYSVDGVRMNTAIFRSGNLQNVINLDPFITERTEVLFGPSSVMYGSDAIGGVMNFQSYEPQFSINDQTEFGGRFKSRYATANQEKTAHLDLNLGLKKWAFLTSISHWDFDDLQQGSHGPDDYLKKIYVDRENGEDRIVAQDNDRLQRPSAYSQLNLMQKVRFKASEQLEATYAFHLSETSTYGRYDRHNRFRNGLPRYGEWSYGPQRWMMNLLSIESTHQNRFYDQAVFKIAHQQFEESRISRNLYASDREIREENVSALSLNLDLNKKLSGINQLFYGVELIQNDVDSKGKIENLSNGSLSQGSSRYPNSIWRSAALYLGDEHQLTEKHTLSVGLRYNYFDLEADFSNNLPFYPLPFREADLQNDALSGSLGWVYRPNAKWIIRSNLSTAFRAPNVDDIGKIFDSEPGAVVVPNPDLQAETAYNLDLGIAKVMDDWLKVELSGFYSILENAMVRRASVFNGFDSINYEGIQSEVLAIQNAARAEVYGVQGSFEIKFLKHFSFSNDLNIQWGEEETDDGTISPSRHVAPFFGISRIDYERKSWQVQFSAQYQGERKFEELAISERSKTEIYALNGDGNPYSPAWLTLNLKFRYQIIETLEVGGGIENLTDLRYRPYSSGISAPGRNFILSLSAKF